MPNEIGSSKPLRCKKNQIIIIKDWVDALGKLRYKIFDVADDLRSETSVDLQTAEPKSTGHSSLCKVFKDVEFEPQLKTDYYICVIEASSPRRSFLDCLQFSEEYMPAVCKDPDVAKVIQGLT